MGRPKENRQRLTLYVKGDTAKKIHKGVRKKDSTRNTPGKVVDNKFEV
jgi:hypothetical protein